MITQESIYTGTDLKILIEMSAPGFSMEDDNWEVIFKSGSRVLKTCPKSECISDDDGKYYALVRATEIRQGKLDIVFHALVPDGDWDDGIRNETDRQALTTVKKI